MFGRIKFKSDKGYAFLRYALHGDILNCDIFMHRSDFCGDWGALSSGDAIIFTVGRKPDGRNAAFYAKLAPVETESEDNIGNRADVTDTVGRSIGLRALYGGSR